MNIKNIILVILSLVILLPFSSCKKDDPLQLENEINGSIIDSKNDLKSAPTYRILYTEWGWTWENGGLVWGITIIHCILWGGNCLPTAIITPNLTDEYDDFLSSYNNSVLPDYFDESDDYQLLFPDLDSIGVMDDLINGKIILHQYFNVNDSLDYFIGLPENVTFSTSDSTWMDDIECVLVVDEQ